MIDRTNLDFSAARMPQSELEALRAENEALRLRVSALEDQLRFLSNHKTLAAGLAGESLISGLVSGVLTAHTASVDVLLKDGRSIEVKHAKLSYSSPIKAPTSARWQWGKIFGEKNRKSFDLLVLVAEADPKYRDGYRDEGSPYVLFLLTAEQAEAVTTAHTAGAKGILLGTNPHSKKPKARMFFDDFQLTAQELSDQIGHI